VVRADGRELRAREDVSLVNTCSDCPDRAVTVSAPSPDPRAVETAQYAPGQTDVQHSLSGRHGAGRARSRSKPVRDPSYLLW
jgi:hypothetical protein